MQELTQQIANLEKIVKTLANDLQKEQKGTSELKTVVQAMQKHLKQHEQDIISLEKIVTDTCDGIVSNLC